MADLGDLLNRTGRFFTVKHGGREADAFYRDRWSHDKVVRSTHGVNCTGSCSWKVYVKDGIITWETQQTDYPSAGLDRPEYEPRGCPRGAAFSWYTYSPTRVRYPYVRGVLLEAYVKARQDLDPVQAWASIVESSQRRVYQKARGKGGLVRTDWETALEIIAAAHVYTIKQYGPDRIAGFSPIPAMSMASHAAGARFMSLIGAPMLSFYDWYADLPVASPQVFGDQTDVPESADWWDAAYLIMWGSNVPVTRTPDAHWMAEARYRGQKVIAVAPDYADNVKFADEWVRPHPGTDGALAMAMGHVIMNEFTDDPFFVDYQKTFTDLPFLVCLKDGKPGKFLRASDLGKTGEGAEWKTVVWDGGPAIPNGSLGFRWTDSGIGKWNLDLEGINPELSFPDGLEYKVSLPRFDDGTTVTRSVRVHQVGEHTVTTVYELMRAQYGIGASYADAEAPYTPAWQEAITGVPAAQVIRIAREFARTASKTKGRCMILLGAGTNHWFHSDTMYRGFLALLTLTGCQGRNGGGWAHYVGQEKCRPVTGWATLASASDWSRPPRQMAGTPYWYIHTDQWRYDAFTAAELTSPLAEGQLEGMHAADCIAMSAKLGWMPSYPTFDRNSLALGDLATTDGIDSVVRKIETNEIRYAISDPDNPKNWPRVLTVWRANLLGSSGKGNEFFLRHLLGTTGNFRAEPSRIKPRDVVSREDIPEGKLDLLVALDFRMTSTTMHADVVLPAATWYEKHDLSSTDMHPFVHAFTPAINPPWQARTDVAIFQGIAQKFSEMATSHLGVRRDLVATALLHDTPGETAQPFGVAPVDEHPTPGRTMANLTIVERDYPGLYDRMVSLGPLVDNLGVATKGITFSVNPEVQDLGMRNGVLHNGRPALTTDVAMCEAILALSGTTNGRLALQGFETLSKRTGMHLTDLALENEGRRIVFADTQSRPTPVVTSPEWSGSETGGRRYSAFTINVEHRKPWHTLTGRQHFYLDHDWMQEFGEALPIYRPPLNITVTPGHDEIAVRYLTPHSKWSIHSEYQDNLFMLTLSRGGQGIWMSTEDAAKLGIEDNDWIEAVNRNGVVVARAIVSHKMPPGTVYMYHAQDRLIDVPKSEEFGTRGGIHNALTRLLIKPTHLIGGYAQLSYGFNYLGPTGNQRDEVTLIRRRSQEVQY